jgi:hypothetical protein
MLKDRLPIFSMAVICHEFGGSRLQLSALEFLRHA